MSCDEEYIPRSECIQNQVYDNILYKNQFSSKSESSTDDLKITNSNFNSDTASDATSEINLNENNDIVSFESIYVSHNPAKKSWGKELYEEIFKIDILNKHKITCFYRSININVNAFNDDTELVGEYITCSKLTRNFIILNLSSAKQFYITLNYELKYQRWNFRTMIIFLPLKFYIKYGINASYEEIFEFIYTVVNNLTIYRNKLYEEENSIPNIIIITPHNIKTHYKLSYNLNYYELK